MLRVALVLSVVAGVASADPAGALREANAAAVAGDWAKVAALVQPLFVQALDRADLGEAHRLEGLAMFFAGRETDAEAHFVAYLKVDLDGHLDPALYPPEVVTFFDEIRAKHAAELRALRPKPRRHMVYNFLPPIGQFQNGDTTKGWILTGAFLSLGIANVTSYALVRSWCTHVTGPAGSSLVCETPGANHDHEARLAEQIELASAAGLVITYIFGVYDGVAEYRRHERMMPFATPVNGGGVVGFGASF